MLFQEYFLKMPLLNTDQQRYEKRPWSYKIREAFVITCLWLIRTYFIFMFWLVIFNLVNAYVNIL